MPTSSIPKPVRDKNPINLRPFKYPYYIGQVGLDTDGEAIFGDWISGIRAGVMDLNIKIDSDGLDTIEKIIPVFAPSSDGNDVKNYIYFVSQATGIPSNQKLITDDATIKALFIAMAQEEMGSETFEQYISDQDINDGIQYYATNEYPVRIHVAYNEYSSYIDWFVFLLGCGMVARKMARKKKTA
jgi:hypothetical protein